MGEALPQYLVGVMRHDQPLLRMGSSAGAMKSTCYLVEPLIEQRLYSAASLALPESLVRARREQREASPRGMEAEETAEQHYRAEAADFLGSKSAVLANFLEHHGDYIRAQCEFVVERLCQGKRDDSKALRLIAVHEFLERVLDIKVQCAAKSD